MPDRLDIPRVPQGILARERLITRLDVATPVVVVRAPTGYGKTTLLAQWLSTRLAKGQAAVYVNASRELLSRTDLLRLLLDAVTRLNLDREIHDSASNDAESADRDAAYGTLFDALRSVSEPVVIVLDGYEPLSAAECDPILLQLAEQLRRVRFVVATRSPLVLRPFDVEPRVDVSYLGPEDLLLSDEEQVELLYGLGGSFEPVAEGIDERIPFVARLLALQDGQSSAPRLTHDRVVAAEFSRLTASIAGRSLLGFCEAIAEAHTLTVPLAARMVMSDRADEALQWAVFNGFGKWQMVHEVSAFVFDPVVRAALLKRRQSSLARASTTSSHDRAMWAFEAGLPVVGIEIALSIPDPILAARFLRERWLSFSEGEAAEAVELLKVLPTRDIEASPALAMFLALAYNAAGKRVRAHALFATVAQTVDRRGQDADPEEAFWSLTAASTAYRLVGSFSLAARRAQSAMDLVPRLSVAQREHLGEAYPLLLQMCGCSFLYDGQYEAAIDAFEEGLAVADPLYPEALFHSASLLAGTLAYRGSMARVRHIVSTVEAADPPAEWLHGFSAFMYRIARAYDALDRLDPDAALRELDAVRPHLGTAEHWALFVALEGVALLCQGNAAQALAVIDASLVPDVHQETSPNIRAALLSVRVLALLSEGRVGAAKRQLKLMPVETTAIRAYRGLSQIIAKKPHKAMATLAEDIDPDGPVRELRGHAFAKLVYASAARRVGLLDVSCEIAELAFESLDLAHSRLPLVLIPRKELLALAAQLGPERQDACADLTGEDAVCLDLFPHEMHTIALTAREMALLRDLPGELTLAQIAERHGVSGNTVKSQLRGLYRKLDASSRQDAVERATAEGVLLQVSPGNKRPR